MVGRDSKMWCPGGENFHLYPPGVLVAGLIIKLTQDKLTEEKETHLICVQEGLVEMVYAFLLRAFPGSCI